MEGLVGVRAGARRSVECSLGGSIELLLKHASKEVGRYMKGKRKSMYIGTFG